jgi:uncharacterized protein (DUF924 family)
MSQIDRVLEFWFSHDWQMELKPRKEWFLKDSNFDQAVREWFLGTYEQAVAGKLDHWLDAALSTLALTIVLDQFPRNMFRDRPQAFASDSKALMTAQHAIERDFDQDVPPIMRLFFYLPFEHSELLQHQNQAVNLLKPWAADPELKSYYDFALKHQAVIDRFGRFPHRNVILGRRSTAEELEFLQQPGASF